MIATMPTGRHLQAPRDAGTLHPAGTQGGRRPGARSLIVSTCEYATEAGNASARRVAAMLGVLADSDVTIALGEDWVLDRLRWAFHRHVAPFGVWHVARLLTERAAAGDLPAGEMCAKLAGLISLRDLDSTADLLAGAAAARSDQQWACDTVSLISLHLGPKRVSARISEGVEPR